jgi:hypothetical protein
MTDPTCHRSLRRFWFPATSGFGVGVTADSEADARRLAEEAAARHLPPGAQLLSAVSDVDVRTLDPEHVLPNIGPVVVRGVWYPRLNL